MMDRQGNFLFKFLLVGSCLAFVFSIWLTSRSAILQDPRGLAITVKDAYPGLKDANVERLPLPADRVYVTVEACVENHSAAEQSVGRQEVFLETVDHAEILPLAVGYDRAEAFNGLPAITEPPGAKDSDPTFTFFPIQRNELLRVPAHQSQGCGDSSQFKSLALLFLLPKEMAGQPYILHFREIQLNLGAGTLSALADYFRWLALLVLLSLGLVFVARTLRKKKLRAEESPFQAPDQDGSQEEEN